MIVETEQRIAELARRQHGVLTRVQLLSAGLTPKMVRSRLESTRLVQLHRGVYLLGTLTGRLEPTRAREMAAVLATGPGAVVSHRSAGWLWKMAPRPGDLRLDVVDVTLPRHSRRRRPGIRARRSRDLSAEDTTTVEGIPITTPLRTLADLSTVLGARELSRAVARATRMRLITDADLATLARQSGRPGAPLLRAVLSAEGALPFTRSEAEERFLALIRSGGLPVPEANVVIEGFEVDFLWRRAKLIVEIDGFEYHASRRSFEGDRRRDAELVAAGYRVFRVTWRQLVNERDATLVRLAGALALGRGRS